MKEIRKEYQNKSILYSLNRSVWTNPVIFIKRNATEIFYALFVMSSYIKGVVNKYLIFDLTLVSFVFLIFILIVSIQQNSIKLNRNQIYFIYIMILFYLLLLGSMLYSSSQAYSPYKFLQINLSFFAFLFPLLKRKFSYHIFLRVFVAITCIVSLIYLRELVLLRHMMIEKTIILSTLAETVYTNYLLIGYIIGISLSILLFSNYFSRNIKLLLMLFLLIVLFATGARGSVLSIALVILLYITLHLKKTLSLIIKNILNIICFLIIITLIFPLISENIIFEKFYNDFVNRFEILYNSMILDKDDSSLDYRKLAVSFSLNKINESPIFGYGLGSFGVEFLKNDIRFYPHNILLEIWFENGLLALLLYIIVLLLTFYFSIINKSFLLFSILLIIFLNALKSFSLADTKIMFSFFAITLIHTKNEKRLSTKRL